MRQVFAFGDTGMTGTMTAETMFDQIVSESHRMVARADVIFNGEVIEENLPITGGKVDYDRTAARLARLSGLTVADPTRLPSSTGDRLAPYGYELQLWRGVAAGEGSLLVPLGVFPIQTSLMDGITLGTSITAEDRSRRVSDARFEDTYQVTAGTNYGTAIIDLISDGVPGLTFLFPSVSFTTPLLTFTSDLDRWTQGAAKMARDIGMEVVFDGLGRCLLRPEPTFAGTPVFTVSEGSNLTAVDLLQDRGPAFNKVIAVSSNASLDEQFRGEAFDNDSSSPTYFFGPFGRKQRFYPSPFIGSTAQAESAASAILASNIGVARTLSASMVANPRPEPADVIAMKREVLGIDSLHIIDGQSVGLSPGEDMPLTVRSQQEAS